MSRTWEQIAQKNVLIMAKLIVDQKYDIVLLQEIMPKKAKETGIFNDSFMKFSKALEVHGYFFSMDMQSTRASESKTGFGPEHFACFYRSTVCHVNAVYMLQTLIQENNEEQNRLFSHVPCAFQFLWQQRGVWSSRKPFVILSVHLDPGDESVAVTARMQQWKRIGEWILWNKAQEGNVDFIVAGDINLTRSKKASELERILALLKTQTGQDYVALNKDKLPTTDPKIKKPTAFDHFFVPASLQSLVADFEVIDLRTHASTSTAFATLDAEELRQQCSDHFPISMTMRFN